MSTKITNTSLETKKFGKALAKKLLEKSLKKKALILALIGDLGGGKTTFLQGLAKGLGIKEKILSPTFVILKRFKIKDQSTKNFSARPSPQQVVGSGLRFKFFYHIDCYRIEKPREILDLGFQEIISNPKNIVAIEWADHIKKIIPQKAVWIKFEFVDKNKRKIVIKNGY